MSRAALNDECQHILTSLNQAFQDSFYWWSSTPNPTSIEALTRIDQLNSRLLNDAGAQPELAIQSATLLLMQRLQAIAPTMDRDRYCLFGCNIDEWQDERAFLQTQLNRLQTLMSDLKNLKPSASIQTDSTVIRSAIESLRVMILNDTDSKKTAVASMTLATDKDPASGHYFCDFSSPESLAPNTIAIGMTKPFSPTQLSGGIILAPHKKLANMPQLHFTTSKNMSPLSIKTHCEAASERTALTAEHVDVKLVNQLLNLRRLSTGPSLPPHLADNDSLHALATLHPVYLQAKYRCLLTTLPSNQITDRSILMEGLNAFANHDPEQVQRKLDRMLTLPGGQCLNRYFLDDRPVAAAGGYETPDDDAPVPGCPANS
ncbi:MAG: hypothetical protein P1U34_02745 [Coxiellaceae bacterium]|nr:hypothetical protein [Coxiellaceae bacterium]